MAIPESQLDTWSHQGAVTGSRDTYAAIKRVLESRDASFAGHDFSVFLQGSYSNDTNIYRESDVDIVIRLNSCFHHDANDLPTEQLNAFNLAHVGAVSYSLADFARDVYAHLRANYHGAVDPPKKAIKIRAENGRRNADVLVACSYHRYHRFVSLADQNMVEGICFFRSDGQRIENFPVQHSTNCTTKHQATNGWFKPMVRVMKNLRNRLIVDGRLKDGAAPSYYIEGLLYNAPTEHFGKSYGDTFVACMNWLSAADRTKFVCANEQYYLLHDTSPVTWRAEQCTAFISAACDLWNNWK